MKLYRPAAGEDENWPNLGPVLSTKTIDWDLIAQQYDQIVKYTTALRLGAAEAEQVLRRLFRSVADILALRPVLIRRGLHLRVESGLLSGTDLASDDPGTKMMVNVLAAVLEF
ncbi:Tn3 family transposase [Streptomyces nitrosporeus]|uniref:Tn3 family transposase n=1 Tax=Streptomyces nitrosporeus TaxID=28894 RepID=UPI00167E9A40|nr:hypothetical protein GCM10010327_58360 [Streptomyces nitrosporeus]